MAGHGDDVPEVGEVEDRAGLVDLMIFDSERGNQLGAQPRVHRLLDFEPDDLAEAATAELLLDRPHHVVGLVGDVVIGVAGDPEEGVIDHLHPGEQRAEVGPDQGVERDHPGAPADAKEATE